MPNRHCETTPWKRNAFLPVGEPSHEIMRYIPGKPGYRIPQLPDPLRVACIVDEAEALYSRLRNK